MVSLTYTLSLRVECSEDAESSVHAPPRQRPPSRNQPSHQISAKQQCIAAFLILFYLSCQGFRFFIKFILMDMVVWTSWLKEQNDTQII